MTAFVGRISYAIYLLHGFVIGGSDRAFLAPYRWGLPPVPAFAAAAMARISFEVIEVPGDRLGAMAVRWLDRRSDRAARLGGSLAKGLR